MAEQKTKVKREQKIIEVQMINKEMGYRIDLDKSISRGFIKYITKALRETKSKNRYELCEYIANSLEENHTGKSLEYHTSRMNLETTGEILRAIDTYMYKKQLIKLKEWD